MAAWELILSRLLAWAYCGRGLCVELVLPIPSVVGFVPIGVPPGFSSERDGARAGEENEGHYGRCDFAVHDALLMISRMRRPASKDNALCRASCRRPDHVIEDECFTACPVF